MAVPTDSQHKGPPSVSPAFTSPSPTTGHHRWPPQARPPADNEGLSEATRRVMRYDAGPRWLEVSKALSRSLGGIALASMWLAAAHVSLLGQRSGGGPDRAIVETYCLSCHRAARSPGGVTLNPADLSAVGDHWATWERVTRALHSGAMPPPGSPRPDPPTLERFRLALEDALDAAAARAPRPGRPLTRRLNRAEYTNAVRDLLDLDLDLSSLLPADETVDGFDTSGSALSLTPALLDRYLSTALRISRLALGDRTIGPTFTSTTYAVSQTTFQDARASDDLPFGSRGGLAVRHPFPLDADYAVRIRQIGRAHV